MKWVAIAGSWRHTNENVERDVRAAAREILKRGDGIIVGGAPGVDYFATDEALKLDPRAERVKIFLPASLEFYARHNNYRAAEYGMQEKFAELNEQLWKVMRVNPSAVHQGTDVPGNQYVTDEQYSERNSRIVEAADELVAFWVNKTKGTLDAVNKAKAKGIPVTVKEYEIR